MDIPQEVLDGIEFMLEYMDTVDNLCYADQKDQDNLKAAGECPDRYVEIIWSGVNDRERWL